MPKKILDRRKFMEICSVGIGSTFFFQQCSSGRTNLWRFFTNDEAFLTGLICEQIIPTDEYVGAIEAGVIHFIDKQLTGPYERFQSAYREGLQHMQTTSKEVYSKNFEKLSWNEQTDLLELLDTGKASEKLWINISCKNFFQMIRSHAMQGYYGSPRHGGNKNFASYKMLDLGYSQIVGQNRYR
jgi:gluconate 2-dehydrogenase gamma chain